MDGSQAFAHLLHVAQSGFLHLPLAAEVLQLLLVLGDLLLDFQQALLGMDLGFRLEHTLGKLELEQPALDHVDLGRHRLKLHGQPAGRLVNQVDRLVGKESVGDVAGRELGRGHQCRVFDLDLVVNLVPLLDAAKDRDRVFNGRLADEDRLEPALEGGVFLDVLAELVQRGGADAAKLAASQGRLEQVGRVHRPLGLARADDQVQLIDEQDDPPLGLRDLLENGFESIFELAPELGSRDQGAHVQRHQLAVLQALGNVARDDPLGQALGDGRLAHARFADQDRVVLGSPAQNLNHPANLRVAADDRVHLALAGQFDEVSAVPFQRLVLVIGVLVGHGLPAADPLQGLKEFFLVEPQGIEKLLGPALDLHQPQEQMLDRDVLVFHAISLGLGGVEHGREVGPQRLFAAGDLGQSTETFLGGLEDLRGVDSELSQQAADDLLLGVQQRGQKVHRLEPLMAAVAGQRLGRLDGFLALQSQSVETESHISPPRQADWCALPTRRELRTTQATPSSFSARKD